MRPTRYLVVAFPAHPMDSWIDYIATISFISFNCKFIIAQDLNKYINILKNQEISSNRLCYYLVNSSYNISLISFLN